MAKIVLTRGNRALGEIQLSKPRMTIGRRSDCDIVLDNPAVSAEHAVIFTMGGEAFLEDQNSKNGTHVNGAFVKKHMLVHDDEIELAQFRLRYVAYGADPANEAQRTPAVVKMLEGENAGREVVLTKLITTVGRPGVHVAVITQRQGGYFLKHVEGNAFPLVSGKSIGADERELAYGDVIDLSGSRLAFARGKPE